MPRFHLTLLLVLLSCSAYSQNSFQIKGKVHSKEGNKPIESATVYVVAVKDSAVVDYSITEKNGSFSISVRKQANPILLKVSSLGYKTYVKRYPDLNADLDAGAILMEDEATNLDEVIIKSEAPPIRIKNDTLEFNASSFKVRPDANVEALLKQLPGVEIDSDGKITVNGKEVNQILVNGKPFFDKDGKIALQNLPSDIINKVQITDSKTKKEEISGVKAASNNASINLTIDEDKNKGFFGKVMGGYGTDDRYESSLLANYFKGKQKISILASSNNINSTGFSMNEIFDSMGGGRNNSIYTSDNGSFGINGMNFGGGKGITQSNMVGLNYADEFIKDMDFNGSYFYTDANAKNTNRTRQVNLLPGGNYTTESNAKTVDDKYAHNFNTNFEYKIDSTSTIYLSPKFVKANSKFRSDSNEFSEDENGLRLNERSANTFDETDNTSFSNQIYYFKTLKRKGRSISLGFDNENSKDETSSLNRSATTFFRDTDNDGVIDEVSEDNRNQTIFNRRIKDSYSASFEYMEPIVDSIRLKIGVEYNRQKTITDKNAFDFDAVSGSYADRNDLLSNYLSSATNTVTPSAGINIEKNKMYFGVSAGTSITKFENNSLYLGQATTLNKDYVLPSANAYINYRFSKSKSLWANYTYTVDFPSANQILPVEDLSDALNTYIGNPDVNPNKSHYTYISFRDYDYATKSGYSLYGGGTFYDNQVVSSTVYDESRKRTTTYENISGSYSTWFGGNWNKSIKHEAHSYRFGIGLSAGYSKSIGYTNGELFDAKALRLTPRVSFNYDYGELFSINPTYNFTYSDTQYTNYTLEKTSNVLHKFNIQTTTYWPKHVVFGNDFGYNYNSNIADGFKKDFYLWNSSLGYNFLGDKLLAKVKVYDLLNQNQSATRTITATSIRDEENIVLKRYLMFSLTYKLDKFGGKGKERKSRRWMD